MDLRTFVPTHTLTNQKICIKTNGTKIKLQTRSRSGPISKIELNRKIKTDKNFWVGLGLFIGERTRDTQRLAVTNSNPSILKRVLRTFESMGIKQKEWKGVISANSYYVTNEQKFKKKAKEYWSKTLKIPQKNVITTLYKRTPLRKRETIKYGTLQLRIDNIILVAIVEKIISNLLVQR